MAGENRICSSMVDSTGRLQSDNENEAVKVPVGELRPAFIIDMAESPAGTER